MTGDRPSFWDPEKRATYLAGVATKSEDARRLRDGEDTAEELDRIWQGIEAQERDFLRALLLTNRQSFVARHDAPILRGLVAKGLLRYPHGHGGSWMRAARTSYSVAPAVWRALQGRARDLIEVKDADEAMQPAAAQTLLERVTSDHWY